MNIQVVTDKFLRTENLTSDIVNPHMLYVVVDENVSHFETTNHETINVAFFVDDGVCNTECLKHTYTMSYDKALHGNHYYRSDIHDFGPMSVMLPSEMEIHSVNGLPSQVNPTFVCLEVDENDATIHQRIMIKHNAAITMTAYRLPINSKIYYNGDDWKTGTRLEYFAIPPTAVFIGDAPKHIGFLRKTIMGTNELYLEYEGKLYKAVYGNGGIYKGGVSKTVFTLV